MDWTTLIRGFEAYLRLEKSLSDKSISAYLGDLAKLREFVDDQLDGRSPTRLEYENLAHFVHHVSRTGISPRSQARLISAIRSFFRYMVLEELIDDDPADLLETPRLERELPDTLSEAEVVKIIEAIDLSSPMGHRDRAILETLYGCGLRVSELVGLQLSDIRENREYIRVTGKGDKERLVPIGREALTQIALYVGGIRSELPITSAGRDTLFLNRRGGPLSRVAVFNLVKKAAALAGIDKNISPHTFRHSFATHMVKNGADLRAVQDMLGHESILTTEIYTHLDRQHLRDAIVEYHPRGS